MTTKKGCNIFQNWSQLSEEGSRKLTRFRLPGLATSESTQPGDCVERVNWNRTGREVTVFGLFLAFVVVEENNFLFCS